METTSPKTAKLPSDASRRRAASSRRDTRATEQEPNDSPAAANEITANAIVRGVISAPGENGGARRRPVPLSRAQGPADRAGDQCRTRKVAARFQARSARRRRQTDSARAAASGARIVLHVPRPQLDRSDRFSAARLGGHGAQRVPVRQRRSREAVDVPARPGFGFSGLSRRRRQSLHLLRHDGDHPCAERAVLHRRAASAGSRSSSPTACRSTHSTTRTTTTAGGSWEPTRGSRSSRRPMAITWCASPTCATWAATTTGTSSSCGRHVPISKSRLTPRSLTINAGSGKEITIVQPSGSTTSTARFASTSPACRRDFTSRRRW